MLHFSGARPEKSTSSSATVRQHPEGHDEFLFFEQTLHAQPLSAPFYTGIQFGLCGAQRNAKLRLAPVLEDMLAELYDAARCRPPRGPASGPV